MTGTLSTKCTCVPASTLKDAMQIHTVMKHQPAVCEISSIVGNLHAVKSGRLLRSLAQYDRLVAGGVDILLSQNHAFTNSEKIFEVREVQ